MKSPSDSLSAPPSAAAEGEGGDHLKRARELEAEQAALVETASVKSRYAAALAVQVEARRVQVERIED